MSNPPTNMSSASNGIDSTPSATNREARSIVESRRRDREKQGFQKLRDAIQIIAPNIGSKFEKADILEQAANLLLEMSKDKKRRIKEEKEKNSPSISTVSPSSSIPSTPSSISSIPSTPSSFTSSPSPFLTPTSPPSITQKEEGEIEKSELPQVSPDFSFLFSNPILNQMFLANFAQELSSMAPPPLPEKKTRKRKAKEDCKPTPEKKKIWRAF